MYFLPAARYEHAGQGMIKCLWELQGTASAFQSGRQIEVALLRGLVMTRMPLISRHLSVVGLDPKLQVARQYQEPHFLESVSPRTMRIFYGMLLYQNFAS